MQNNNWKVTSNFMGEMVYQVYRIVDLDKPDHSGNREYSGGLFNSKKEAQKHADNLNDETSK